MSSGAKAHPTLTLAAVLMTGMAYAVSQTSLIPALPVIERQLGTTTVGATALMSTFFIAGAVTVGPVGRLGDMFGKRRMLIVAMALFCAGSLLCVLADSLALLLVGRVIMGSAIGLFPLTFSILRDQLPPDKVPSGLALMGSTVGIGGAAGLASGGVLADGAGFHWVFGVALVMGVGALAMVVCFVPESPTRSWGRVDVPGVLLLVLGLGGPLVAIAQSTVWGWSDPRTIGLLVLGVLVLAVFVRHEYGHPEPLLHLPTLALPRVLVTNLVTALMGFGMFGSAILILEFLQVPESTGYGFGLSATQAGLFLVPGSLLTLVSAPLVARTSSRYGPKTSLLVGCAISAASLGMMAAAHHHQALMYVWPSLMLAGNGFAFAATPALILGAVPPGRSGQSTGANMIARLVGSSWGTMVAATLVTAATGPAGAVAEHGYTSAFVAQAAAAAAAFVLALAIPVGRPRGRFGRRVSAGRRRLRAPVAVDPGI